MGERNDGIDFLRLVSMYMIVALHVLGVGGVIDSTSLDSVQYHIMYSIQISVYCCVNCFGLISGYVMVDKRVNYKKILKMWVQVLTYNVVITAVLYLIGGRDMTMWDILKSFFPIITNSYWYFSAYLGLVVVMPLLNIVISYLNKRQLEIVVLLTVIITSFMPTFLRVDIFNVSSGYSSIWLIVLFFLGAYIKRYKEGLKSKKVILVYVAGIIVIYIYKVIMDAATLFFWGESRFGGILLSYNSPIELIMSIALVIAFKNIKLGACVTKLVRCWSPLAFGVYLVHTHPIFFQTYFKKSFGWIVHNNIFVMLLNYFCVITLIFCVCLGIEFVRCRCMLIIEKAVKKLASNKVNNDEHHKFRNNCKL